MPEKAILVILSSREMCKFWLASDLVNCRHTGFPFPCRFRLEKKWVSVNLFLPPWTESSGGSQFPPRGHHRGTPVSH